MNIDRYQEKLQKGQLLTQNQVNQLADQAIQILVQEPNLIQLSSPQYLIGDVHGQYYDFLKMLKEIIPQQSNYVFLGDYVDRGYHSIQTICYLLVLKCKLKSNIVLLRGNHQTSTLTRTYGFYDQVMKKYGNHSVWNKIIQVFTYLPLAAIIDSDVFCVHGGLSPSLPYADGINQVDRIRDIPQSGLMCDLVWSDPQLTDKQGWSINNRGAGYIFSKQVVNQFLQMNNLKTIVRAHQLVQEGHIYNFQNKSFVTLWSAPNYCYRCGNQASVMKIQKGNEHNFLQFGPSNQTDNHKIHYQNTLPYFL